MKFLLQCTVLIVFAAFRGVVGSLEEVCQKKKALNVDNKRVGYFWIEEAGGGQVKIVAEVDDTWLNTGTTPYITKIQGSLCCKNPDGSDRVCLDGGYEVSSAEGETPTKLVAGPYMNTCPVGSTIGITLQASLKATGGDEAFNLLFPVTVGSFVISVDFRNDNQNVDEGWSYLEGCFKQAGHPLDGKCFNGYCVDQDQKIVPGIEYRNSVAISYHELQTGLDTNFNSIKNLQNMDNVAYCMNKFEPGNYYDPNTLAHDPTKSFPSVRLGALTLQEAIWIMTDGSDHSGLAKTIADHCLANGDNFVPGCGDYVPIVVLPQGGRRQNQFVRATYASLGINCWSDTDEALATDVCEVDDGGDAGGDPHFKTFGNHWFDFHGGCDLLLASFPDFAQGLGLTVQVRTTTRYDYSFIETAAIMIGGEILQVSSHGHYMVGGISDAEMPATIAGYPVEHTHLYEKQHRFTVDLGDDKNIELKVYKDLVYVKLNLRRGQYNTEFDSGFGILGSWNNGARLARDGATILDDDIEFGNEWQVRDTDVNLFAFTRAPQWPAKCEMPDPAARPSRRLGESAVSAEAASAACAHIKDQHRNEMCVYDVLATADLSVAQGGAY